jgi:hypothetical protein
MHHRSALDPDLVEQLMQAELDRDDALLEYARSRTENLARRLYESLASFDYDVARERAVREQARRDGVVRDDGYDRSLLAAEAAVIDSASRSSGPKTRTRFSVPTWPAIALLAD